MRPWILATLLLSHDAQLSETFTAPSSFESAQLKQYGHYERTLADGSTTLPVYQFKRENDSSLFAVKQYRLDEFHVDKPQVIQDIRQESDIARRLDHPHILKTFDVFDDEVFDTWSIVSEYCTSTLTEKLNDAISHGQGMPTDDAFHVFRQLVDGLEHMHSRGIAHHDIKPSNVMFDANGNVKIIDFGTAYQFRDALGGEIKTRNGPIGTLPFNAPEMYSEKSYDPEAVDIWALALLYCVMIRPDLPWKFEPTPEDLLEDTFSIFSSELLDENIPKLMNVSQSSEDEPQSGLEEDKDSYGFAELVDLLPLESQRTIAAMLEPNPKLRANWSRILTDNWLKG